MKRQILNLIIAGAVISIVPGAFPAILINEIMYNPTVGGATNEWIEIVNTGSSTVNFSGILQISTSADGTSWTNRNISGGLSSIAAGERIVIARNTVAFNTQYSGYFSTLYTAGFSLHNDEPRYIRFWQSGGTVYDIVYYDDSMGADGNGMSLERLSASWAGAGYGNEAGGYGNWVESKWSGGTPGHENSVNPEPTTLLVLGLLGSMLGGLGITMRRKDRKES